LIITAIAADEKSDVGGKFKIVDNSFDDSEMAGEKT